MTPDPTRRPGRQLGYATAMTGYGVGAAAVALAARRRGGAPASYDWSDLALGAVATHKMARIVSKEQVTSPLRAPFTEAGEEAGAEEPREGHRHTVGELLLCPFCLAPWIAGGYVAALALVPTAARAWAATFSVVGGADLLQHVYARVRTD